MNVREGLSMPIMEVEESTSFPYATFLIFYFLAKWVLPKLRKPCFHESLYRSSPWRLKGVLFLFIFVAPCISLSFYWFLLKGLPIINNIILFIFNSFLCRVLYDHWMNSYAPKQCFLIRLDHFHDREEDQNNNCYTLTNTSMTKLVRFISSVDQNLFAMVKLIILPSLLFS